MAWTCCDGTVEAAAVHACSPGWRDGLVLMRLPINTCGILPRWSRERGLLWTCIRQEGTASCRGTKGTRSDMVEMVDSVDSSRGFVLPYVRCLVGYVEISCWCGEA